MALCIVGRGTRATMSALPRHCLMLGHKSQSRIVHWKQRRRFLKSFGSTPLDRDTEAAGSVFVPDRMSAMSVTNNKLLADRVWEEIWHQGNLQRMEELFAPDFVRQDPGREIHLVAPLRTGSSSRVSVRPSPTCILLYSTRLQRGIRSRCVTAFRALTWATSRECRRR